MTPGSPNAGRLVGFVGIGTMGEPMIKRLSAAGFTVRAYDVDPAGAARVAGVHGVEVVSSLPELSPTGVVVCMLPSSAAVEEVVAGPGGLLERLQPGSLIVDMGSSDPTSTAKLAHDAVAAGHMLVDAPVSGGVAKARTGQLTVMFGGSAGDLDRCRGFFEAMADHVVHVGAVSSGHAMKALNNLLSAVGLATASEVIEVGRRYGLDPNIMLDVINHSTGRNHATETKFAQFVLSGTFASGFALRLMLKDIKTAVDLARTMNVEFTLGAACLEVWSEAAENLPPDADQTRIALMAAGLGHHSVRRTANES